MLVNDDLIRRAVVETEGVAWVASPLPGVFRKMLDRDGGEVARATSVVRYDPGSIFSRHVHELGEEFLVLDGVFSDERGHYPAGTYVRNPPGSSHVPFSKDGCVLFVKLRQFATDDQRHAVIDTRKSEWQRGRVPGVAVLPLHTHGGERVYLVRWGRNIDYPWHDHPAGEEIFVIEGSLEDEHGHYPKGTWVRQEPGSAHKPSSPDGALLYVKVGHLAVADAARASEAVAANAG